MKKILRNKFTIVVYYGGFPFNNKITDDIFQNFINFFYDFRQNIIDSLRKLIKDRNNNAKY